jgi:DNA-binding NtrC family response regulator
VWSPGAGRESPLTVRLGDSLGDVEERLILHTVRHCRTQDEAARMLGISTKTLYNKLRLYESQRRSTDAKARFSDTRPPATRWT